MDDKSMVMVESGSPHPGIDNAGNRTANKSRFVSGTLERYLSTRPTVAFGLTLQCSWEVVEVTFQASLLNGGPVSMVYGMILAGLGTLALALSLAEMASMDPVVGAQYRWTALYAPRLMKPEFWSWIQGWLTVFAWIAGSAATPFLLGTLVQGLIIFNYADYAPQPWHGTLLMCAFVAGPILLNIYARKLLVSLEIVGSLCHFFFFICTVVILVVTAERSTNDFVFKTLINDASGWTNPCAAFSIGLLTVIIPVAGFDGTLHMSAEVKNPTITVPRSMVMTVIVNSVFSFAFIICLLFTLGDLATVASSPTGYPIIEVYYEATKSVAGTNTMVAMLIIVLTVACFGAFASTSRLVWAFARDNGLPFSNFFSYIHPGLKIPLNAVGLVCICCFLLSLINIGSTSAFYIVLSITAIALYISYIVPTTLLLIRKLEGRHPAYGPWKLGRWGIPINLFAIIYGLYVTIWLSFPVALPITPIGMNYAAPLWIAVLLFALGTWFLFGRKRFQVPMKPELVS